MAVVELTIYALGCFFAALGILCLAYWFLDLVWRLIKWILL